MIDNSDKKTSKLLIMCILQSLIVLLAGFNIYFNCTASVICDPIHVRWREMISLLFITPVSIILLFVIHKILEQDRKDAIWPLLLLMLGCCWVAISMGVHEPINAFRIQFGYNETPLSRILWFWDDIFSHIIFFAGYVTVSCALLWSQSRNPLQVSMSFLKSMSFLIFGILAGVGITYSLVAGASFSIDFFIMLGVLVVAEIIRAGKSFRTMPLCIVMESSYFLSLILLALKSFTS